MRMVEIRRRLCLGAEALHVAARREAAGQDHLQFDDSIERDLAGLVNLVEQLLAVGHFAGLDGQHVGGDERVEGTVGHGGIVGGCHG